MLLNLQSTFVIYVGKHRIFVSVERYESNDKKTIQKRDQTLNLEQQNITHDGKSQCKEQKKTYGNVVLGMGGLGSFLEA